MCPAPPKPSLFTIPQAAQALGYSESRVRQICEGINSHGRMDFGSSRCFWVLVEADLERIKELFPRASLGRPRLEVSILVALAEAKEPVTIDEIARSCGLERAGGGFRDAAQRLRKQGLVRNHRPGFTLTDRGRKEAARLKSQLESAGATVRRRKKQDAK
jgi:AraC-like DNA-binding protein